MPNTDQFKMYEHPDRQFAAIETCIYCGSKDSLTREHIVPYSAGGRWVLPKASCSRCAKVTGKFEGEFARTILGPLRMLYQFPTRRPKERPKHLPLKVKYKQDSDWEEAFVDRELCPFLIGLPLYPEPSIISGSTEGSAQGAATKALWIRGANFWPDKDAQLEFLCRLLRAHAVMPSASICTEPYCLTIAKVAHAYAVSQLGLDGFEPFLLDMIRNGNMTRRSELLGGGRGDETPQECLHDLNIVKESGADPDLITVHVRLLANFGTPSHRVVVGTKIKAREN